VACVRPLEHERDRCFVVAVYRRAAPGTVVTSGARRRIVERPESASAGLPGGVEIRVEECFAFFEGSKEFRSKTRHGLGQGARAAIA
jgi:hypothetical protein